MNDSVNPNRPRRALPLRPLAKPVIVTVRTDEHGEPTHVRLPGKTARRVDTVRERWRIDDEWWRERISREYRAVVLDDGRVLTLFRDLSDDRWYVQKD
ncbi:MAG: hypothetical protein K0S65_4996 [Labilithrix sp.]|nr:hypothetical protein [Labilithrix sp.]